MNEAVSIHILKSSQFSDICKASREMRSRPIKVGKVGESEAQYTSQVMNS